MMIDFTHKNAWLRPFKNGGTLLLGRGARGLLSIGYLAFATRALGVEGFGVLTIIYGLVMVLRNLLGFQSWQMILRYGALAIKNNDACHLKRLVFFGIGVEALAALVGIVFVFLFTTPLLSWFDITADAVPMVQLFILSLFVLLVSDVFMGVLRLLDRHDAIARNLVIEALVRFVGAGVCFWYGFGLWEFVLVWLFGVLIGYGALILTGARVLFAKIRSLHEKEKNLEAIPKGRFKAPEVGLWRYLGGTNLEYSLGAGMNHIGPILVGIVLGPAGAGLYSVAQRFAGIIDDLIQKVFLAAIYTDMAWLNTASTSKARRHMVMKAGGAAGGVALLVVGGLAIVGPWLITLIAGENFIDAYPTMVVLTLATVVLAATFTLEPLLMTAGKVRQVIFGRVLSLGVYAALLVPLVHGFGLMGPAFAMGARHIVFAGYASWAARYLLAKDVIAPLEKGETS